MSKTEVKSPALVRLRGITKRFENVVANDSVDLDAYGGQVHALLGENGAGKTTLMRILYGLYTPDAGQIHVRGEQVEFRSPHDPIKLKIGMVHQHFMLISPLSVAQNVVLGLRPTRGPFLDLKSAQKKILELSDRYGLKVDPAARIWQLSAGEQQRVEIIKALYRGVEILILDEPTSVLTPLEVKELFSIVRKMADEGHAVIFITHKMHEVFSVSDVVTVLRDGKVVGTVETKKADGKLLARMMIGRELSFRPPAHEAISKRAVLRVENLKVLGDRGEVAVKDVSLQVFEGEILGIAGVAGNGQREMIEAIAGLRRAIQGRVAVLDRDVTNGQPAAIIEAGVAHIPEDRLGLGLMPDLSVSENLILETHSKKPFANGIFLNDEAIIERSEALVKEYGIKTPSVYTPVRFLSGGNLQRLILARELSRRPKLILAAQPTKGLDIGATEFIRSRLIEEKTTGMSILLVSEDLDELLAITDRLAVMYEGKIMGQGRTEEMKMEQIGLMMAGISK